MARSATFESMSDETVSVVMLGLLCAAVEAIASASRLNQSKCCQTSVKSWRKLSHAAAFRVRRGGIDLEIAPALVRTLRDRCDDFQLSDTDDVDSPVATIVEAKDAHAADDSVLHDPVEISADQL